MPYTGIDIIAQRGATYLVGSSDVGMADSRRVVQT
jgi:hypothetical protein